MRAVAVPLKGPPRIAPFAGAALAAIALAAIGVALLAFQGRELADTSRDVLEREIAADATFAAALIARIDLAGGLPPLDGRRITVVAADGRVLADSAESPAAMDNHGSRPEILAARGAPGSTTVLRRRSETMGQTMLYAANALADGRVVRVGAPLPDDAVAVAVPFPSVLASTGAMLVLCYVVFLWHRWRARARAIELRDVAADFTRGHFARRASLTSNDAFGQVGRELNALGERLQETLAHVDRQRRLLDGALGALDEGVACVDRLDHVIYANAAYRALAAGGRDVVGDLYYEHLPAARLEGPLASVRDLGSAPRAAAVVEFAHHDRLLAVTAAPGGPDTRVLIVRDLTGLRRLEGARRDFMAAVSHEFKTPLTTIAGFAETLLDGALETDPATARRFIETIARQAERLNELVRDVLALSRLEQGSWVPRLEEVDVVRIAEAVLEDHQPAARERGIRLHLEAPGALPATTDQEVLRQVLGNLLSNAVRYNRAEGQVRLLLAARDDGRLAISVVDTGIGIPPEHQARVFDRFYRVDSHRSRQTGGTGLGLAIVKQFVELLGGTIALASDAGGTRFDVVLPSTAPAPA